MLQCFGFVHPISNSSYHLILTFFGSDFVNQKHTTQIEHRAFHFLEIHFNAGRKHTQLYCVCSCCVSVLNEELQSLRTDTQQNFQPAIVRQLKHRKKVFIPIIQTEKNNRNFNQQLKHMLLELNFKCLTLIVVVPHNDSKARLRKLDGCDQTVIVTIQSPQPGQMKRGMANGEHTSRHETLETVS